MVKPILLDANTLVSGLIYDGNERRLLRMAKRNPKLFLLSEHVLKEVLRVIDRKFPALKSVAEANLKATGLTFTPATTYRASIPLHTAVRDIDDRHLLACAIESGCQAIVTGDKDLLDLGGEYQGVKIWRTWEAIGYLEGGSPIPNKGN